MRLLIVEADIAVRRLVTTRLDRQGVTVTAVATAGAALTELRHGAFDVAILDLRLPDGSGLDLMGELRERGAHTHVIILSAAGSETDRLRAFEAGADDYVLKPFFVRELAARVLAVRRHQDPNKDTKLEYGPLAINLAARRVTIDGASVKLSVKEFDLLAFLAARPGYAFSRDELLRAVWQSAAEWQQPSTVTEHMRRLRAKIERDAQRPRFLHTVRGHGYRFDPPATQQAGEATATPSGVDADAEGTIVVVDGWILSADATAGEMLGVGSAADLVGRESLEFVAPQSVMAIRARRAATASGRLPASQVVELRRADGTDVYMEISTSRTLWNGKPAGRNTIRSRTDPSARLRHMVTGVFSEVSDAVIVTDPHFHVRSWNQAAERLYGWAEPEVLGRHISDVVPFVERNNELTAAMQALEEKGRWYGEGQQITRDGTLVDVSVSTTLIRDDTGEPVVVVSVNRPTLTSPSLAAHPSADTQDEAEIRRGLERGEFEVYYQPVVSLADSHIISVEALARWNHPDRGILTPAFFIDAAERSGVILELGRVVFNQACQQTAAWRRAGINLEVAVNLSTRQLADPALFDDIIATLAASELDPAALWLEVTETALVEDLEQATDLLDRLADLGIRIAIDDFGTGWASLTYLKQFPVHALKIDQIFVDGIDHNPQDAAIARSILTLGQELDMIVIAEGVETVAQQCALQALGCTIGQGFLFGKPTPAAQVATNRAHQL